MTVSVVVPWRAGCPHREAALTWVLQQWQAAGYAPALGEPPAGPWCKAAAVAAALPGVSGELLVIADADVWTDGVEAAVAAVRGGAPWAVPHGQVRRLSKTATAIMLAGGAPEGPLTRPPYTGYAGGGITVLPRALYERVPLDPRFTGWGQEDEAWALALRTLAGLPWRGTWPLWHLWHPTQPRDSSRWGSVAGRALYERYRRAARTPDAMAALVGEMEVGHGASRDSRLPGSAPRAVADVR
ncbi:hypothetical protein [Streptomyces phytophilus]|uniref:hypothetical protein n=1 Tax=Streptomyces phytophilus TaxID=722715 RepID=UPI0015F0373E|nr:hypothetical protein [Streptomyces phytophilus]